MTITTRFLCSFAAENHRCQLALVHSACRDHQLTVPLADSLLRMRNDVVTSSCRSDDIIRDVDSDVNGMSHRTIPVVSELNEKIIIL